MTDRSPLLRTPPVVKSCAAPLETLGGVMLCRESSRAWRLYCCEASMDVQASKSSYLELRVGLQEGLFVDADWWAMSAFMFAVLEV